jgi:hypothetical protein
MQTSYESFPQSETRCICLDFELQQKIKETYSRLTTSSGFLATGFAKIVNGVVTPIALTSLWLGLANVIPALMAPIMWEVFISCEFINVLYAAQTAYRIWQQNGSLTMAIIEPVSKAIMAALGGAGAVLFLLGSLYPADLFTAAYAVAIVGMFTRFFPIITNFKSGKSDKSQLITDLVRLFIDEAAAGLIFVGAQGLITNQTIKTSQAALVGSIIGSIKKFGESFSGFVNYLQQTYQINPARLPDLEEIVIHK